MSRPASGKASTRLAAAWATVRAPSAVLLPGLVGLPEITGSVPGVVLAGLTLIGLVLLSGLGGPEPSSPVDPGRARLDRGRISSHPTRRGPSRATSGSSPSSATTFFPQIGLVALIAAGAAPWLRRFDEGRARGFFAGTCLAGLLAVVQYPAMKGVSDRAFRFADQPRALEAAGRLEVICGRRGITLPQAMNALEPIRPPWFPKPWPFNPLLHLLPIGPAQPRLADPSVRPTLIEALSPDDRECLFGGMNASRYAIPWPRNGPVVEARPMEGTRPLEYAVGPEADDARALSLLGFEPSKTLELWWAGEGDDWSPYRSVRWEPGAEGAVALEMIPHWRRGQVRRIRVMSHDRAPVAPGLIRFFPVIQRAGSSKSLARKVASSVAPRVVVAVLGHQFGDPEVEEVEPLGEDADDRQGQGLGGVRVVATEGLMPFAVERPEGQVGRGPDAGARGGRPEERGRAVDRRAGQRGQHVDLSVSPSSLDGHRAVEHEPEPVVCLSLGKQGGPGPTPGPCTSLRETARLDASSTTGQQRGAKEPPGLFIRRDRHHRIRLPDRNCQPSSSHSFHYGRVGR